MHGKHEEKICPKCQRTFECSVGSINLCQCAEVRLSDATKAFLEQSYFDCFCKNCLTKLDEQVNLAQNESFPPKELIENVHYYMENSFFVFTEWYHLLRGYCCRSGCRHCAYGFKKEKIQKKYTE